MSKIVPRIVAPAANMSKPEPELSKWDKYKPNIIYAKPLYYISLITGLSCPIDMDKYYARNNLGHKLYSCFWIGIILAANGLSFKGRLSTTYTFLLQTVVITDMIQQVNLLILNVYSIVNVLLRGEKYIQTYFIMLKQIDAKLSTIMNLRRKKIIFNVQLLISHVLMALLCVYDFWTWTNTVGVYIWQFYSFRLYSIYLTLVIVFQIYTFSTALKIRFQILNERLFDVSLDWIGNVHSQEALTLRDLFISYKKNSAKVEISGISLHCIVKMHDLLCDVVDLLNNAFGLNTVLLVCCVIVNSVIALNFTLIFATGVQPTTGYSYVHLIALNIYWAVFSLAMGVAVARSCDDASKEAYRSATICYKLLGCIPIQSNIPREMEARILLKQLANQIEHRKPGFDACGFFPINHSMLYAILGAVSSYIVIIIQFNNSPVMNNIKNVTQV